MDGFLFYLREIQLTTLTTGAALRRMLGDTQSSQLPLRRTYEGTPGAASSSYPFAKFAIHLTVRLCAFRRHEWRCSPTLTIFIVLVPPALPYGSPIVRMM